MTSNRPQIGGHPVAGAAPRPAVDQRTWTFVCFVVAIGVAILVGALVSIGEAPVNGYALLLAALIVASGRFRIKVPGRSATVSVSEVFVFASLLLFGPGPATLTVAFDGLLTSLTQRNRRLHRTLFNIAEPAISAWVAGQVFFVIANTPALQFSRLGPAATMIPTIAMAAAYFLLNSTLTAVAVALESHGSAYDVWQQHALVLGINSYAAASVATLAVKSPTGIDFAMIGLVAPLLVLSYTAYKAASNRIQDSLSHISEVEHLYRAAVETLAIAVDAKDQVTHGHIRRVQRHTVAVARVLGVHDQIELKALEAASLLHDVGKLAVPDYVLNKPGALSHAEFERIKLHAAKGAEILTAVEFPYPVVPIVRSHHEQWNGKGYPDGLSGEAIPFGARILTVVDCFDAVTSDRPYRRRMTDTEAIEILRSRSGSMYDPRIVSAFIELVPILRRDDRAEEARVAATVPRPAHPATPPGNVSSLKVVAADGTARMPPLHQIGVLLTEKLALIRPAAQACLFAPETGADFLVVAYATALVRDAVAPLRLRVGEGLAGWVAANRHTIVNSTPDLDIGDAAVELGLLACTAVPVFALGNLVAVLSVYLPSPRGFSEADVRAVGALAQEIGLHFARFELEIFGGPAAPCLAGL
ncbi:MAG: HD domain-containing phosphohydrolase [Acidobacteriota bacterium]